jgi:hypothetical protein
MQAAHAFLERRLCHESKPLAHGPIDRPELDELFGVTLVSHFDVRTEHVRHRADDVVDADWRTRREVQGA